MSSLWILRAALIVPKTKTRVTRVSKMMVRPETAVYNDIYLANR